MPKTKAALHYYARNITGNNSINSLYYIGDTANNIYDNTEGGRKQKNNAHFIELASALSIIDFANTENIHLETNNGIALDPKYKEFATKDNSQLSFNDLFEGSKKILMSNLTEYFYFNLFLKEKLKGELNHPYAREFTNKIDDNFLDQTFYKTLSDFNTKNRIWLAELSSNRVSFSPFWIKPIVNEHNEVADFKIETKSIFTLIRGTTERKNKFNLFAMNNYNLFIHHLNKVSQKIGDAPDTPRRFMGVFSEGTKTLVKQKLL